MASATTTVPAIPAATAAHLQPQQLTTALNDSDTRSGRTTHNRQRADERLCQQLIALMQQGINPWRKPWNPERSGQHRNLLTGRPYQGGNPALLELHLALRGSDLPLWIGFQQAKTQGWQPRKGSHGCLIYRPLPIPLNDEAGDCENPSEQDNTSTRAVLRFRPTLVFHAADLHDAPATHRPPHHRPITAAIDAALAATPLQPLSQRLAAAEQHLAAWPVPLFPSANHAFYLPARDQIHLPPRSAFHSPEAFLATWAHKQIHSTGHSSRLNRDGITGSNQPTSDAYAREELIAELGAFLLTQRLAIASDAANHAAYLQHWAALLGQGPRQLTSVLADASRAANLLCPDTTHPN
jgi:antirestriction protein ArdC